MELPLTKVSAGVIDMEYVDTSPALAGDITKSDIPIDGTEGWNLNLRELSNISVWSKSTPSYCEMA